MTPLVWAILALCLLAILIVVGIPYWITFIRRRNKPDHSEAHARAACLGYERAAGGPVEPRLRRCGGWTVRRR